MRAERNNLRHGRCFVPAILIFWTPLSVSSQNRDVFRAAAPESQGLASSALKELSDVVRGFVDKGKIVGAELLVIKNRMILTCGLDPFLGGSSATAQTGDGRGT